MTDRYQRDDNGAVTGKQMTEDPGDGPTKVTARQGRPQDKPGPNSTFGTRAKARADSTKRVKTASNKAVQPGDAEEKVNGQPVTDRPAAKPARAKPGS